MSSNNQSTAGPSTRKKFLPKMPKIRKKILQQKFFLAVYQRHIEDIMKFIDQGVDPNMIDEILGVGPLHVLAERDDTVLAYLLIQNTNVNLGAKTAHGETALHIACLLNKKKFAIMLLHNNADVETTDRFGRRPLHVAIEMEHFPIIVRLLKAGANPNVLDCFDNTPLSNAICKVENYLIARTLFEYGADFSHEEHRPLHIFFETILQCRSEKQIPFVTLLLERGVPINQIDTKTGRNCLHYVAISGNLELAIYLVQEGAKWDVVDIVNRTPVKVALDHGNTFVADYLYKRYRPPNLLKVLPKLHAWTDRVKQKIKKDKEEREMQEKEGQPRPVFHY